MTVYWFDSFRGRLYVIFLSAVFLLCKDKKGKKIMGLLGAHQSGARDKWLVNTGCEIEVIIAGEIWKKLLSIIAILPSSST